MATLPKNDMETFEKGFMQGWKLALERQHPGASHRGSKAVPAGHGNVRPRGTAMENLIIRLGEDGKR
jgi:hypothetical protein